MRIAYVVNPVLWSPWDKRLGASEQWVRETAKRLVARDHQVTVHHRGMHGMRDGVRYRELATHAPVDFDCVVNVNDPMRQPQAPTVHFSTIWPVPPMRRFPIVLACSSWHAQRVEHPDVRVCSPGWDEVPIDRARKDDKLVIYTSSPDRGLRGLLAAWPLVRETIEMAQLIHTYAPNHEITDQQIAMLYRRAKVWCHPCTGQELYCVSGVKAQIAGCWPVYYPHMALADTMRYGTSSSPETLAADLIAALRDRPVPDDVSFPTWSDATDTLEQALQDVAR